MEVDLEIENYNLNDLLKLFNITHNYDEDDLKICKKQTLATHPDKSGLDKKYFLFYSKAYKYIYNLYNLRKGSNNKNLGFETDYKADIDNEQNLILDNTVSKMNKKDFHTWFNEMFEKNKIRNENEDSGYGEWLKSDEGLVDKNVNGLDEMNKFINEKKNNIRSLVKYKDFTNIQTHNANNILNDRPEYYSSDMNSSLKYDDIMRAHNEGVIPVTEEDYKEKQKFRNVDELNIFRTKDLINKEKYYKDHNCINLVDEKKDLNMVYKLMKQDENIANNFDNFWKKMKTLKHKE